METNGLKINWHQIELVDDIEWRERVLNGLMLSVDGWQNGDQVECCGCESGLDWYGQLLGISRG